jgi:hypothetical protein
MSLKLFSCAAGRRAVLSSNNKQYISPTACNHQFFKEMHGLNFGMSMLEEILQSNFSKARPKMIRLFP